VRFVACAVLLLIAQSAQSAQSNTNVRALFSPWDDVEGALTDELGQAQKSIDVQAYLLTSRVITRALLSASSRGVRVRVLADAKQAERAGAKSLDELVRGGVAVWQETRYAAAHNKLLLIDLESANPVVITGSYNFTWSAQARNAENVVIITGDAALAKRYAANWRRHRDEAEPYTAATVSRTEPPRTTHAK
jgi:phosphatidylserine/phosphatidylglycerophosphate/cardiolipin synthase-like enzyme